MPAVATPSRLTAFVWLLAVLVAVLATALWRMDIGLSNRP